LDLDLRDLLRKLRKGWSKAILNMEPIADPRKKRVRGFITSSLLLYSLTTLAVATKLAIICLIKSFTYRQVNTCLFDSLPHLLSFI
jgi:hypothetical protein